MHAPRTELPPAARTMRAARQAAERAVVEAVDHPEAAASVHADDAVAEGGFRTPFVAPKYRKIGVRLQSERPDVLDSKNSLYASSGFHYACTLP